MKAGIIINPAAGPRRWQARATRVRHAETALGAAGLAGEVRLTAGRGSARGIAGAMIAAGATTVVAWGGDGTINEVASAVVPAGVTLGVVPGGSGNGFARALDLERHPVAALRTALTGRERRIDTGEIDGRLFVNVAGVGLDAHLAAVFNRLARRGPAAYIRTGLRELRAYRAATYGVETDHERFEISALLLTVANGREYGAGATIAPAAQVDDGRLDLVCVPPRSAPSLVWEARRLFLGTVDRLPGVRMVATERLAITAPAPLTFHVDGEVHDGGATLEVRVRPGSLVVRVPEGQSVAPTAGSAAGRRIA